MTNSGWIAPEAPQTPAAKPPRTIRARNAAVIAVASLGAAPATQPAIIASDATAASTETPTIEPTIAPTAAPTPSPTPEPARPIVVKGKGSQNTKPFDLPSGDFTVTIAGTGDGNVIVYLKGRGDASGGENLFNEIAHGKYKYETVVYGLVEGSYYLDVVNDNAWVVTFTPLA